MNGYQVADKLIDKIPRILVATVVAVAVLKNLLNFLRERG